MKTLQPSPARRRAASRRPLLALEKRAPKRLDPGFNPRIESRVKPLVELTQKRSASLMEKAEKPIKPRFVTNKNEAAEEIQPQFGMKPFLLSPPGPGSSASEDAALMRAIAERDPEALATLYDRYSGILKALVIRVVHDEAEADDLLQEIFMQIWRQAKNYSQKKGQALGWIVTLTRRRAIDRLRKRQAYHRVTERLELEVEHQPDSWVHNRIEDDILKDDLRQFLRRRIDALPALQKQAIDLAFFKGMSQREIAVCTNTPLGTIKTRLELGLRKLYDSVRGLRDKI